MFGSHGPAHTYAPNNTHGYPPQGYPPQGFPMSQPTTYAPVTHQPSAQASNNIVMNIGGTGGMNNNKIKAGNDKGRPWTTDLCGCLNDVTGCMCAWWFPACFMAQLAMRLDECVCMPFCVPQAIMAMRILIRERHGIRGGICDDCLMSWTCPLLTLCQMKRELDNMDLRQAGL